MRWIRPFPKNGDRRVRHIFLNFPRVQYNNEARTKEIRWWEWAWVEEEYIIEYEGDVSWWFRRFATQPIKTFQNRKKSLRKLENETEKGFHEESK